VFHPVARQLPLSHEATALVVSTDGKRLVASSLETKRTVVYDLRTGRALLKLGVGATALAVSPDGQRLVTAWSETRSPARRKAVAQGIAADPTEAREAGQSVRVWDLVTGRCLTPAPWEGEAPIALSPDGRLLAVATHPESAGVLVMRLQDGARVAELPLPERRAAKSVTFCPDGRFLVAATGAGPATFWSVDGFGRESPQSVLPEDVAVAFSPDGQLVAAATPACTVRVASAHDPSDVRCVLSVRHGHRLLRGIEALSFSPDGELIIARGRTGATQLWSLVRERPLWTASPGPLAFLPDGKTLAAWWCGAVWLRDAETGDIIATSDAEPAADSAPDTARGPSSRTVTLRSRDLDPRRPLPPVAAVPVIERVARAPVGALQEAAAELLGRLSTVWAERGYRKPGAVAARDADGLGIRLPLRSGFAYVQMRMREAQLSISVTATADESDPELPPSSSLVRLSRWIRDRISAEARRQAAADREWAAEIAPEGSAGEPRVERGPGSLTIHLERTSLPTLDDLEAIVRAAERQLERDRAS
jgi:hypothetical protein